MQQIFTFSSQAESHVKPLLVAPIFKEVIKLLNHTMPSTLQIKQNIDAKNTIIIDDTGHGITPDVIDKIFDPFFTTKKK